MRALLDRVILVGGFFLFIMLSISCQSLLACRVAVEKSANKLIGILLCIMCFFSLAAFNIFSLSLTLVTVINMCLRVFLLGFILYSTHCAFCIWVSGSFSMLGKFFGYYLFKYFFWPFLSLSPSSGTSVIWMLVCLILSQSSLRLSSFLFHLFSLFCSTSGISTSLSYSLLIHFPASCILLLVAFNEFLISIIVFCISALLIFMFLISLFSVSRNLSIFASRLFPRS